MLYTPHMIKMNPPSGIDPASDSITLYRHDGGWVANVKVTVEVCGCTGPDVQLDTWYQIQDDDDLDVWFDGLMEQADSESADVPDEDEDDDVDPVTEAFVRGFGDGR